MLQKTRLPILFFAPGSLKLSRNLFLSKKKVYNFAQKNLLNFISDFLTNIGLVFSISNIFVRKIIPCGQEPRSISINDCTQVLVDTSHMFLKMVILFPHVDGVVGLLARPVMTPAVPR